MRSDTRRTKILASIPILFILAPIVLWAQEGRGTITGRVSDVSGAVIAGAEVRVTNKETGATAVARSNESGNYTIPYLLPGVSGHYHCATAIRGHHNLPGD